MPELSAQDIINIHQIVQNRFQIQLAGVREPGLVESIAVRPKQVVYGTITFPDIFSKAASLMEAIIRWHPFVDGNKRTALLVTNVYLGINGYTLMLPLSAVRFSVKIAQVKETDQKTIDRLLRKIAKWIRAHSASEAEESQEKFKWHLYYPAKLLMSLDAVHLGFVARLILSRWLALDIYPEYRKDMNDVIQFVVDAAKAQLPVVQSQRRKRTA